MAYTYLHLPIVAGIILCAAADEIVLVHPGHADTAGMLIILGGPFVYLCGNALFKWVTNDRIAPPLSHLIGIGLLVAVALLAFSQHWSALLLSVLTTSIFLLVAIWETLALRRQAVALT